MSKYRIMTFDGGGMRGALTTTLLKRLSMITPSLIEDTNLFAGTSTGSFIALGLAYGRTPSEINDFYSEGNGRFVFTPSYLNLFRPKYNNANLKTLLSSVFPKNLLLKDLKNLVVVPSFRLTGDHSDNWSPVFFHNFPGSPYLNEKVIDVALASSAAPIYFPSYKRHIDGGVIANNPSTAAIAIAKDEKCGKRSLMDIVLLSIGTGQVSNMIKASTKNWGILEWIFHPRPPIPILTVLTDGDVEADEYISSRFLGNKYTRLNPHLPHPVSLDNYKAIATLKKIGEEYDLTPTIDWLDKNWNL